MNSKSSSLSFLSKPTGIQLLVLLSLLLVILGVFSSSMLDIAFDQILTLLIPFFVSIGVAATLGYGVVPMLRQLKASQVIQEDGPQSHLKKAGTPTMGGIFFVPIALLLGVFWTGFNGSVIAVALVTFGYMGIGFIDDWQILRQQSNKGLTPKQKLILQIGIAVLFSVWLFFSQSSEITQVQLPGFLLPLGLFFWLLAGFTLVAESNATNLTDGVDGLA
ncbi:MAG: phospho-N-acetylmuramoyl-pentapeptide-transferase, partial [Microcystaceae cyanobacterium]